MTRAILTISLLITPIARGQCNLDTLGGRLVSMHGDVVVVGDPLGRDGYGVASVFRRKGLAWVLEAELTPPEVQQLDSFGGAIATDGDRVVVGASTRDEGAEQNGAAFVFASKPNWILEATLTAPDAESFDDFGWSVAIDADRIVVGARLDDENGVSNAGSAHVFENSESIWQHVAKLTDPTPTDQAGFGQAVAICSTTVAVGAHGDQSRDSPSGSVYVFRSDTSGWILEDALYPVPPLPVAWFGWSVALGGSGTTVVVGAPQEDSQNGAAYIFTRRDTHWEQSARLTAAAPVGPFPLFGWSVSLSDNDSNILHAGSLRDSAHGSQSGAAHLFRLEAGAWIEMSKVVPPGVGPGDLFGASVSIDHDIGMASAFKLTTRLPGDVYILGGLSGADCNNTSEPDTCEIFAGEIDDANDNLIPDDCEAMGDLNGDGWIAVQDLILLILGWGDCRSLALRRVRVISMVIVVSTSLISLSS